MAESLETSSPATMAHARASGMMSKMAKSTTWTATDSLNAMLGMAQKPEPKVTVEEDSFGFPSIEWLGDDADATAASECALKRAFSIIKQDDTVFQRSAKQAKRRRVGEPQGMVRSKAMKSGLSSLTSCSMEQHKLTPLVDTTNMHNTKFVLGATWGSMVTARDALTKNLATCSLKTSPFVDTTPSGLLTV